MRGKKKRTKLEYKQIITQKATKQAGTTSTSSVNVDYSQMSPRTLWGKIIIYLREHHAVALHIACGDITDVEKVGDKFVVNTAEEFLYELLKSEENYKDLKQAFSSFGINNFEIVKKEKILTKSQQDINILKDIFGNKLII